MEQQLVDMTTRVEVLEKALGTATLMNTEIFYWWCTALMIAIHAGFLAYEMGASRAKNALASGMKNLIAFAFLVPTFFYVGWWIYLSFPGGLTYSEAGNAGLPWAANMGPNLSDQASGIFYAAFTLFAATTASIMSGSVIERIRISGFAILAVFLGSVVWILGAAWGWHPGGWLTATFGLHDTGAAGCVHMIAGFFTLGVLINLGPRLGRYNKDGTINPIVGHNMPMSLIGLMLIVMGFFGFLGGCIIYTGGGWTTIYNTPTTLSAFGFNTLMAVAGGMIGSYLVTRDPFWMMSGALIGVISSASGLELYYPGLAFLISFAGGCVMPKINTILVERFKIDDAVGAVAVHGFGGLWGLLAAGIFASGYPNVIEGAPPVSFFGQFASAMVFLLLGFIPGYALSYVLKMFGLLRVAEAAEVTGLDKAEVPARAYPESAIPAFSADMVSPSPAE
ncbi:ammonia channel protein AmtB [Peteryoungia aggregata LMG 23059]|uniref:Ammonia channel protein AmtB n=1 Tax=Peteryoungia aggregata LMG 23059 TaxID=1368425 RepID=A0ABU0G565_9HYPH|nr:ammonium transporter [Peteryoungia aggregata]MDQ0420479.1 ammonia channel protein AmtB [Peteryoungia aggregata LMG 23059]